MLTWARALCPEVLGPHVGSRSLRPGMRPCQFVSLLPSASLLGPHCSQVLRGWATRAPGILLASLWLRHQGAVLSLPSCCQLCDLGLVLFLLGQSVLKMKINYTNAAERAGVRRLRSLVYF